ncbi:Pc12g09700 [Penicillium rubens Wisconsin 54-1255]|uniref:Pc12g09700 protein n=1 Tax=Penicillium rubens (strain ATCC 28089 / DSM 1075 / NRRL 1951 / Wisconsin 54-1255) TaxID=500485 RepID=B6GZR9_PENRW|nr:Pc12g09700 [Penicillium rubens Wisconsin 54-1255]
MSSLYLSRNTPETSEHMKLVKGDADVSRTSRFKNTRLEEELITAPLFSLSACETLDTDRLNSQQTLDGDPTYPQYGLLGLRNRPTSNPPAQDDLVYANVSAPWSAFICGSQGSGKSHTLSCLLENALISSSPAGKLSSPLAGLVIHYDKFTAFSSTQLCEAAYLHSSGIPVRKALNISMMKTLMGINNMTEKPLYIEVVMKILRDMAIANQGKSGFNYSTFKLLLQREQFLKGQLMPLNMRLEVLESFFEPGSVPGANTNKSKQHSADNAWKFPPGTLTIIDLSCPFVGQEDACALFNIAVSLFLKNRHDAGRIIALDEAHKFMTSTSPEAADLTDTLLSVVRQQRHLAARVLIATQEPTLAPALLELCNVTIIHRFSSPAWFKAIKSHIAGAEIEGLGPNNTASSTIFRKIVRLPTGEALSATTDSDSQDEPPSYRVVQLGTSYAHIRVRNRITVDGGRSVLER